jgi:hypothetical protein
MYIRVSIYCVSSVFYFRICFILFLHDPIFLTPKADLELESKITSLKNIRQQ